MSRFFVIIGVCVALGLGLVMSMPACGGGASTATPLDAEPTDEDGAGLETEALEPIRASTFALTAANTLAGTLLEAQLGLFGVSYDGLLVGEGLISPPGASVSKYAGAIEDLLADTCDETLSLVTDAIGMECSCIKTPTFNIYCDVSVDMDVDGVHYIGNFSTHTFLSDGDNADDDVIYALLKIAQGIRDEDRFDIKAVPSAFDPGIRIIRPLILDVGFAGVTEEMPVDEIVWVSSEMRGSLGHAHGGSGLSFQYDGYTDACFVVPALATGEPEEACCRMSAGAAPFFCYPPHPLREICDDHVDNDQDGDIDCEDDDCAFNYACGAREDCFDGIDNDGDGLIDCNDLECLLNRLPCPGENCLAPGDEEGDGLEGCADLECAAMSGANESFCVEGTVGNDFAECDNGIDDDGDGAIDCADWRCLANVAACAICGGSVDAPAYINPQCFEGDLVQPGGNLTCDLFTGLGSDASWNYACVDHPDQANHPDVRCCLPAFEISCNDGADNDLDGLVDCRDEPDCVNDLWCTTREWDCGDEVDNNLNGLFDCDDPDCLVDPLCAP